MPQQISRQDSSENICVETSVLFRKLAVRILPPLYLIYVMAYLDRMNVGFAQLQMKDALQFNDTVYGLGAGIFFLGYALFEIPSNLMLEKIGAKLWLTRIMITWGLISSSMVFISTPRDFYILRLLLGIAEAGSFPGIILYFSYWFPASIRAKYGAMLITASAMSGLIGAPMAGFLLSMDGLWGWQGWQWLFIVEGIPSVVLGVVLYYWLTDRPEHANWLSPQEKKWLIQTLATERHSNTHTTADNLYQSLIHPQVWILGTLYFSIIIVFYSISLWLPQIIKSISGLGNVGTAYLTAIPYFVTVFVMVLVGSHSDKVNERRWHIVICAWIAAIGFALSAYLQTPILALFAITLAAAGVWSTLAPFWTLPHALLKEGAAKASGLALINSIGNLGGFGGPYLVAFLKSTTGDFKLSTLILSLILSIGVLLVFKIPPSTKGRF